MEPNSNYEEQNKLLRQLNQLRNKRRQLQQPERPAGMKVQEAPVVWELQKQAKKEPKLYQGPLIYDRRDSKPPHIMSIHRLFNQKFQKKSLGFDMGRKIKSIMMTAYGFQSATLEPIASIGCPLLVVNQMKDVKWNYYEGYNQHKNWTVVQPKQNNKGWGVFHSKLWLIEFQGFLRVVVGTGNLHMDDWSTWGNAYWYQDFERRGKQTKKKGVQQVLENEKDVFDKDKDFEETLRMCLKNMIPQNLPKRLFTIDLSDFEFTNIDVVLIPSIPGSHSQQSSKSQGIGKVKHVINHFVKQEKIKFKNPTLTTNATSIGDLSLKFLQPIFSSFTNNAQFNIQKLKLVYPSEAYVETAEVPPDPLFFTPQNYHKHQQSRGIFHYFEPNPLNSIPGYMPHLKTVIVQSEYQSENKEVIFYIGSHNFTKAAWGGVTKADKLTISNSELGVLFLNFDKQYLVKWLPYKYPPQKYEKNELPSLRGMPKSNFNKI